MSYFNIPERPLDPPEDKRRRAFSCTICDDDIREGDDYYDIDGFGPCCEACIKESKRHDAEAEYEPDPDEAYDSMREEAMLDD